MKIDILTLFPDTMNAMLHESILGRAAKKGIIDISCVQIRDFTENRQCQVDDYPYGGGWGCVLMAQPLKSCLDSVLKDRREKSRVIYMSPQGKTFTQETARRLCRDYEQLVLVCGHYEGVDERFIEECVDEEISIGDFVLTGGEIAAMAVADSVCRLVPGVLADEECFTGESHWSGLLEYPQYTRPETWEGRAVPEVLTSGDHAAVERWRRKKSLERTMDKRPDMFEKLSPNEEQTALIAEIKKERSRRRLTEKISCEPAKAEDLDDIMLIVRQAKNYLKRNRVDQWQGAYPKEENFLSAIEKGECHVLRHGTQLAGFFCLSFEPEPDYDSLTDGKWRNDAAPYCTVHRAAVAAEWRGTGMSERIFAFAEELARLKGVGIVRVDTHRKNLAMKKLLARCGYSYRGNVTVSSEPSRDSRRQAFDKLL